MRTRIGQKVVLKDGEKGIVKNKQAFPYGDHLEIETARGTVLVNGSYVVEAENWVGKQVKLTNGLKGTVEEDRGDSLVVNVGGGKYLVKDSCAKLVTEKKQVTFNEQNEIDKTEKKPPVVEKVKKTETVSNEYYSHTKTVEAYKQGDQTIDIAGKVITGAALRQQAIKESNHEGKPITPEQIEINVSKQIDVGLYNAAKAGGLYVSPAAPFGIEDKDHDGEPDLLEAEEPSKDLDNFDSLDLDNIISDDEEIKDFSSEGLTGVFSFSTPDEDEIDDDEPCLGYDNF